MTDKEFQQLKSAKQTFERGGNMDEQDWQALERFGDKRLKEAARKHYEEAGIGRATGLGGNYGAEEERDIGTAREQQGDAQRDLAQSMRDLSAKFEAMHGLQGKLQTGEMSVKFDEKARARIEFTVSDKALEPIMRALQEQQAAIEEAFSRKLAAEASRILATVRQGKFNSPMSQ